MRKIILVSILVVASCLLITLPLFSQNTEIGSRQTVDNFQESPVGKFPPVWRTWPFQRGKASEVYKIAEENGHKFLRAMDDKDLSQQTLRYFNWEIDEYPFLSWRWRARELPQGAREDDDSKNDSACGVYVIFGGYSGNAMKYVWSTSLPIGQIITRRGGKLKMRVTETGKTYLNQWRSETVNVPSDYLALFGDTLKKKPSGIAILTDGNATHTAAACDYSDFTISNGPQK